jgi:hypothetical protein
MYYVHYWMNNQEIIENCGKDGSFAWRVFMGNFGYRAWLEWKAI